jgi:hypothetical protein
MANSLTSTTVSPNWNPDGVWATPTSSLYALALITTDLTPLEILIGRFNAIAEFHFPMAPKSMNLEEAAAVQIVPTQRGQFIEHQGSIFKNIQINGTTGLRPNKQAGGLVPFLGVQNPVGVVIDPLTGLPLGERTGFDDLISLRNLFRAYYDAKEDPELASRYLMIWQNGKDGEYYIVEPISFRTNRDSSSPMTATYDITLKTIERLDVSLLFQVKDDLKKANSFVAFVQRVRNAVQTLANALSTINAYIDRLATLAQNVITTVLSPATTLVNGLTNIVNSTNRFLDIPRNSLAQIAGAATDAAESVDKLVNNVYGQRGIINQLTSVANLFRVVGREVRALFVEDNLWSTPFATTVSNQAAKYSNPITGAPLSNSSVLDLNNVVPANSAGSDSIQTGEDIRMASQRLLGDAARWKELVLLNNLKAPYISPNGDGINVLRPGADILYPRSSSASSSVIAESNDFRFSNSSVMSDRLGTDIRLVSYSAPGGLTQYDVGISVSGDLDMINGVDNLKQACVIKFGTERGRQPTHPNFGAAYPLGTKLQIKSLISFQVHTRGTLLSDSRIQDVSMVDVRAAGNVVKVSTIIQVRGADQTLPLNFEVQR